MDDDMRIFYFLIPYVLLNYSDDGTKVGSISSWNVTSPAANDKKKRGGGGTTHKTTKMKTTTT